MLVSIPFLMILCTVRSIPAAGLAFHVHTTVHPGQSNSIPMLAIILPRTRTPTAPAIDVASVSFRIPASLAFEFFDLLLPRLLVLLDAFLILRLLALANTAALLITVPTPRLEGSSGPSGSSILHYAEA